MFVSVYVYLVHVYTVYSISKIYAMCVVNSQSFDFGGVFWERERTKECERARGRYFHRTNWTGSRFKRMKKEGKLFSNQHRDGVPRHGLVIYRVSPMNGGGGISAKTSIMYNRTNLMTTEKKKKPYTYRRGSV